MFNSSCSCHLDPSYRKFLDPPSRFSYYNEMALFYLCKWKEERRKKECPGWFEGPLSAAFMKYLFIFCLGHMTCSAELPTYWIVSRTWGVLLLTCIFRDICILSLSLDCDGNCLFKGLRRGDFANFGPNYRKISGRQHNIIFEHLM